MGGVLLGTRPTHCQTKEEIIMIRSSGVVLLTCWAVCGLLACPPGGATGGKQSPPKEGTTGIEYGPVQAKKLEMPGGPKSTFSVYTVTSKDKDATAILIHGFNHTGHTLLNASDVKIDPETLKLVPETTFKIVYTNT